MMDRTTPPLLLRVLYQSPTRVSIIGFAALILTGTLLLMLPAASGTGHLDFVDALFTATSASCVTGLVVVDTGQTLSNFGQYVVLCLMQIGGLGIMTMSTLILFMIGKRPSLAGRTVIHDTFTHGGEQNVYTLVGKIFLFTLIFEGIGAGLMMVRFVPSYGISQGIHLSVFHAISAFCNAGFSLFSDSFVTYQNDWYVNGILSILIICGGIGFAVIFEIKRSFGRGMFKRLSLHSKLCLVTTAMLVLGGTILILIMEWKNTMHPLPFSSRLLTSFFQSVTSRTAGFNTLVMSDLANETLFFLIILMFIGASPGSCGGGIKTTTLATLVLMGISRFKGVDHTRVFKRTIPESCTGKAINIILISSIIVIFATMTILSTELGEVPHAQTRGKFLELFFEVVSAFGTVGLSTGITSMLSVPGKILITMVMFVGRLGPLVIALAIKKDKRVRIQYAEENIMIG